MPGYLEVSQALLAKPIVGLTSAKQITLDSIHIS